MLACITGGYNVKERLRCIAEVKGITGVAGYVIEGFHMNGESASKLNWDEMEPVLTEILVSRNSCALYISAELKYDLFKKILLMYTEIDSRKSTASVPWSSDTYHASQTCFER